MINTAIFASLTRFNKKTDGDWDFDNILTFDTFEDFEKYVNDLKKNQKEIPEGLIDEQELQQLKDEHEERKIYYGLQSDEETSEDEENDEDAVD